NDLNLFRLVVEVAFHHTTHAREHIAVVYADERHALRGAAHFPDLGDAGTNQYAAGRDQHDLVIGLDKHRPDYLAVAGGGLNGNHALGTASMTRVFDNGGTLAETVFGCGKHGLRLVARNQQRNDALPIFEGHAANTARRTAHGP